MTAPTGKGVISLVPDDDDKSFCGSNHQYCYDSPASHSMPPFPEVGFQR
jgi:hypothetical protein